MPAALSPAHDEAAYQALARFTEAHGYPPNLREFALLCGVRSSSTAQERMRRLVDLGWVARSSSTRGRARGLVLVRPPKCCDQGHRCPATARYCPSCGMRL